MVLLVPNGTVYWNVGFVPLKVAAVFTYGPCTIVALCSVNEPALSKGFDVVKAMTALVPTSDMVVIVGEDAKTVRVADGARPPEALVTATV